MEVNAPAAPQAPTPEVPAATPAAEAPKPVSPQFEALARKEAMLVKRQQELKRMEQELEGKRKTYETFEEKRAKAKTNPIEALQEMGLTYEQITQYILNDKKPTPDMEVASVKDEIQKMREQFESRQREERESQERQAKEQETQHVAEFKANLADFISEKSDSYELCALAVDESVELVHELMLTDWQNKLKAYEDAGRVGRPPKVMSTEDACRLVEETYQERIEAALKTKKLSSKYQAAPEMPKESDPNVLNPPTGLAKTLNNGLMQPSAPSSLPPKNEQERIKRALAALG